LNDSEFPNRLDHVVLFWIAGGIIDSATPSAVGS
jgi:hypothetical protein